MYKKLPLFHRHWLVLWLALLLAGCAGVDVEDYTGSEPRLDIAEYFVGETRAWGMVQDFRGEVQRRFTVDIDGSYDGQTLVLDEHFVFDDGETDRRIWTFERVDDNRWRGSANDVEGSVDAAHHGHVFNMRYPLDVEVGGRNITFQMDDWMYLQPDGRLINRTAMRKFGITLGEITIVFDQQR
ncbi:DUF3833 domain-containing protein [Franzmannia qiaohouensis]|uniref:DUF3833 domain-containing protein n=1 Tax=Franzmannia qiaohouensis TaxID=1329370 RepID=A0ABU1HEH1_9GAMM|nr:DUF3833 domain-containing protein [Halomonas qiaohouensis]MDR5905870.1 DUF3833 domain-containing protein [Halomonas qiaohouensis]